MLYVASAFSIGNLNKCLCQQMIVKAKFIEGCIAKIILKKV